MESRGSYAFSLKGSCLFAMLDQLSISKRALIEVL